MPALLRVSRLLGLSPFSSLISPFTSHLPPLYSRHMSIVAVGSIALDTIKTPFGQADDVVGGSLTYFAVAASYFTDVNEQHMRVFEGRRIDLQGVEHARGKTFRWGGEYSYNLNSRETLFTDLNVFEGFRPKLPDAYRQADVVFLGNMHPNLQQSVLDQVADNRLVGM